MRGAFARLTAACVLLVAALGAPLGAEERILRFQSAIEVLADGALEVEETITVRAEGDEIKRGIYRDFPVRYPADSGLVRQVGFTLLDVRRDGRPEPHFTKRIGNVVRIYAGEESVFLRPGEYTYVFRYRTTRQIRHFEAYDELYWNVTGNFWSFPIAGATATVTLPEGAEIVQQSAYTGRFGETGSDVSVPYRSGNVISYETTRSLVPGEGLTIAVAFPKGIVAEPDEVSRFMSSLRDNIGVLVLALAALVTGAYFYLTWRRVGRDPEKGIVIPLFKPPAGLSPAAVSYVHYQGFEAASGGALRAFIAALMSLAVKRRIRIEDRVVRVGLEAVGKRSDLPAGEAVIMSDLLGSSDRFDFNVSTGKTLKAAQDRFRAAILREHEGVFFRENRAYFVVGAAISVAALAVFVFLARPTVDEVLLLAGLFGVAAGGAYLISIGARWMLGLKPGLGVSNLGTGLVFLGVWVLLGEGGALFTVEEVPVLPALWLIAIALMNVTFFHLLRAPTTVGRKVMDEIEGFALYLSVAEAEWMNLPKAPEMSTELFEAYLPYAVALGLEKPWSDAFEGHMARVMPDREPDIRYEPDWYRGDWSSQSLGRATSGVVSSLSSSMAASMPSDSSSGSGGGGSSGGGGGGGGGGGW